MSDCLSLVGVVVQRFCRAVEHLSDGLEECLGFRGTELPDASLELFTRSAEHPKAFTITCGCAPVAGSIRSVPASSKSSILEDLERGRRLKLLCLSGAVVRLGRDAVVPTPTHRFTSVVLTPFVNGVR